MITWIQRRIARRLAGDAERGSAIVEFVFIAVLVFIPLVYLIVGFNSIQRGIFASTEAAREAGRAIGSAPDAITGMARAQRAAELAVLDQVVDLAEDLELSYRPAGGDCEAPGSYQPVLAPGEEFLVCVEVVVRVPMLPDFIDANRAIGVFVVERDRYAT